MEVNHLCKAYIRTRPGRAAFGGTSVKQETESPSAGAKPRELERIALDQARAAFGQAAKAFANDLGSVTARAAYVAAADAYVSAYDASREA